MKTTGKKLLAVYETYDACFVPPTSITIYQDGTIEGIPGEALRDSLSVEEIDVLKESFHSNDFFSLKDDYHGPRGMLAGPPIQKISYFGEDREKTVEVLPAAKCPKGFTSVRDKILEYAKKA